MSTCLDVALTICRQTQPMALVDGLLASSAELRPVELRQLAAALLETADDPDTTMAMVERLPDTRRIHLQRNDDGALGVRLCAHPH